MSLRQAADYLQRDPSALSRFERAEWPVRRGDVLALLDLYAVTDERRRKQLIQLSEDVWRTDRWDAEYGDIVDQEFIDFTWLESRANRICSYHVMAVPGLLQTEEYAEVVIRSGEAADATDLQVARWLRLRLDRQQVLTRSKPPTIAAILDETVLRRPFGGSEILRHQLEHLVDVAGRRNIDLRVLPLTAGTHAGLKGTFYLFEMPDPYPEVGFVESLAGRLYVETPKTERFVRAYDQLRRVALDPLESAKLIAATAEELS
jgi:hypothetical protein